jgi:hypothetical protein
MLRIALKRTQAFCNAHGLPLLLVSLAAFGTIMHATIVPRLARVRIYNKTPTAEASVVTRGRGSRPAAGGSHRHEPEDESVFELEQLNEWECKPSKMLQKRIRILDLDGMLAQRAGNAGDREPAVARLMQTFRPVNQDAVHAAEKSHLQKLIRSCETFFGVTGVSEDLPEHSSRNTHAEDLDMSPGPSEVFADGNSDLFGVVSRWSACLPLPFPAPSPPPALNPSSSSVLIHSCAQE